MMKTIALILLTFSGALAWRAGAATFPVTSTFDSGLEGWTLVPEAGDGGTMAHWSGGNPGGSMRFTDGGGGANGTVRAPAKFLGNWSAVNTYGHLQYEHRITRLGGAPTIDPRFRVWIYGRSGTSALWRSNPAQVSPSTTQWVLVLAPMVESQWTVTGNWNTLIADVTRLEIEIEMVENDNDPTEARDQDAIDNVRLVAGCPPSTIRHSEVEICWPSLANAAYRVEFRIGLPSDPWQPLATGILGTGAEMCVFDRISREQPQRFYRVVCE